MSYLRTAHYSPERAKVCKSLGTHGWAGASCSTCGLQRDDYNSPHSPASPVGVAHPRGGVPVGHMVPIPHVVVPGQGHGRLG